MRRQKNGCSYEHGLLCLNSLPDPMDDAGFVHLSRQPGLGYDINFDYLAPWCERCRV